MWLSIRVGFALSLLACGTSATDLETQANVAAVRGSPRLSRPDAYIPFSPGFMNYDRHRGSTQNRNTFANFGAIGSVRNFLMETPVDPPDMPDIKYRARVTLEENNLLAGPVGDVLVSGTVIERVEDNDGDPTTWNEIRSPESEILHFSTNMVSTSTKYFDELTSVSTVLGLQMNTVEIAVEWWNGHEQEVDISVPIENIADKIECEDGYRVYFNGKETRPEWSETAKSCSAGLSAGNAASGYRGLYFGIDFDRHSRDAYHHFFDAPTGHYEAGNNWFDWIGTLSAGKSLYEIAINVPGVPGGIIADDTFETRIRPIVVELKRQSDSAIVDTARTLVNLEHSAHGRPFLVRMNAGTDVTGTIAQLSPRGLDRLQGTHVETLPYPISPAGTQPRLSQSAIALAPHTSNEVVVKFKDLDTADLEYWTRKNPGTGPEFAGFVAYEKILDSAKFWHKAFEETLNGCDKLALPLAQAACQVAARASYCVQSNPNEKDFQLRIAGVDTYFDPARKTDALVIGDVTNLDLSFGNTAIRANFILENIVGWFEAWLDPSRIHIEYISILPLCLGPTPHLVSDFAAGTVDYNGWLTCHDLEFNAASATLAAPLEFALTAIGEALVVLPPAAPIVTLFGITEDHASGTCSKRWLGDVVGPQLLAWQNDIELAISTELATSPGEDEALDRLLAPFELGVEAVGWPLPGTPPYTIHPIADYTMSAQIAATPLDLQGMFANATQGMYVPYITRMTAASGVNTFDSWMCPTSFNQACSGNADPHQLPLTNGRDPNNALYDVSITYSTAHINQALWTQSARSERLGSATTHARLDIADTELRQRASTMGFARVVAALDAQGGRFGIRFHQDAVPYVIATDAANNLIYVTPNIVVEIVTTSATGTGVETVVAKMLYDIVDLDHQLAFSTAGVPTLTASWGDKEVMSLTSTFLPNCYGAQGGGGGCDRDLRTVVDALLLPVIEPRLLDIIENAPGLHRFDAGQESIDPRQLRNVRTFVQPQGVTLVADLCDPDDANCD